MQIKIKSIGKYLLKVLKFGILPIFFILLIASVGSIISINFMKKNTAYRNKIELPNSIDTLEPVMIGGIEQWISIRGHNKDAPILLYLHGGPGFSMIRLMNEFSGPLEEFFTVVHWDQRGAGKSYYPTSVIGETMSVAQSISDTEEVIQYLQKRLNKKKIFLLGQSWGSILGIHIAKEHPDWLYAYIGLGQQVVSEDSRKLTFSRLMDYYQNKGNTEKIKILEDMHPFPDTNMPVEEYYMNWSQMQRMLAEIGKNEYHQKTDRGKFNLAMLTVLLQSPTFSMSELLEELFVKDRPTSLPSFKKEILQTNIPEQIGFEFETPIFFISGIHDWQVHYEMVQDYYSKVKAPYKDMLLLNNSSHLVVVEEPGMFLYYLVNSVLPIMNPDGFTQDQKLLNN